MKKPFKKVISLAAAAVMALSSFSLTAFAVDSYELYVNGEQFTSDNLTIACGDGTAVFDGVDTLTLNNATIDKPSGSPAGETLWGVINSGIADLKIVLNGDNVLDGDGQRNDGIDAVGGCSVTIKGNGTLNLNDCCYGTYIGYWEVAGADLTISDGASVTVTNSSAAGLWVNHDITFKDCTVNVNRESKFYNGIVSNVDGTITVTNSDVTVTNYHSAILMGNTDDSSHAFVINSGNVKLTSASEDDDDPTINVEPNCKTGEVKGTLTVNGGTLDVTSALKGTNIPESNITLGSGVSYTKGTSLADSGNIVISKSGESGDITIDNISVNVDAPKAGTVIEGDVTKPLLSIPSGEKYYISWTMYVNNYPSKDPQYDNGDIFGTTMEGGKDYYFEVYLTPEEGYAFAEPDKVTLKVNNGDEYELGYCSEYQFSFFSKVSIPRETTATRLSGSSRYETAAKIADEVKAQGSVDRVFLVNADKFADALAGVPLAVNQNAAILLASKTELPDATLAEIKKLGVKNITILGGNSAVGKEAVEDKLTKQGYNVTRIKGSTRYETATNIAEKVNSAPTAVFVVYSQKFPDALGISSIAAKMKAPILYVDKKGIIDANTKAYLTKHKSTIKKAYVIGGKGAVSDDVKSQVDKTLGITSVRISGSTRYETCTNVLQYSDFKSYVNGNAICVTTGEKFPDALAGGILAAKTNAPVLLVNKTLDATQKAYLAKKKAETSGGIASVYILGGKSAVPEAVKDAIYNAVK